MGVASKIFKSKLSEHFTDGVRIYKRKGHSFSAFLFDEEFMFCSFFPAHRE